MIITIQDTNYSIGGMIITIKDTNYSTRGIIITMGTLIISLMG